MTEPSGSPGSYHDAYEIKTSADPAGGSPSDMRTRLSVGTDADLADVSVNYADNFYVRDGSTTTFAVNTGSGDVTLGDGTNEEVKIDIAGSRSAIGYDLAGGNIVVQGGSGKGISFCTNNATFGSGEVWSITSAGCPQSLRRRYGKRDVSWQRQRCARVWYFRRPSKVRLQRL